MTFDTIIAGAGPAGSAAAIRLSGAGQRVLLIEREKVPSHKVCGEFLSGPAVAQLAMLGVDPFAMGGSTMDTIRIATRDRQAEARLPFLACGLSRLRLDEALQRAARDAGAELRLGEAVRQVEANSVTLAKGERFRGERIVVATGKHDLPQQRRCGPGERKFVGFKIHLHLTAEQTSDLDGSIELHLFEGGYAGIQCIEDGLVNLSFVIDDVAFAMAGRSFSGALGVATRESELLSQRLNASRPAWAKPLAISNIPYGFRIWDTPSGPDWLWPIGDQAAVIPSFTGDGMAMALSSGLVAAQAILRGDTPHDLRAALRSRSKRQFAVARALSALMSSRVGVRLMMSTVAHVPQVATLCAGLTRVECGTSGELAARRFSAEKAKLAA